MISCKNITKAYKDHTVINNFSYEFKPGNLYMIHGVSGCGKSTLLNLIGRLDKPTSGTIEFYSNGKVETLSSTSFFRNRVSYLFQNYALVEDKTVKYNLLIALEYSKSKMKDQLMKDALKEVGLTDCLDKRIFTLSGGEQQRVALARSILKKSSIILADEPTGNLDESNANEVKRIFSNLKEQGKTVIIATHDESFLDICDYDIVLKKFQ